MINEKVNVSLQVPQFIHLQRIIYEEANVLQECQSTRLRKIYHKEKIAICVKNPFLILNKRFLFLMIYTFVMKSKHHVKKKKSESEKMKKKKK